MSSTVNRHSKSKRKHLKDEEEYESVIVKNTVYLRSLENAYNEKISYFQDANSVRVICMATLTLLLCLAEIIVGIIV